MSGNLPSGVTDADIDRAIENDDLPCRWEKLSGVCMVCGSGPDDPCVVEAEREQSLDYFNRYIAGDR
jgi:hypothetical protein